MTVYLIADIKVTNGDWVPAYARDVHTLVERHGGKYLSRSGKITMIEGPPSDSTLIALLAFPDQSAFQAFATDPDYAPYGAARQAGSRSIFTLIDDTDIAGAISYLPKG
jgi:uncharacterized protein (DUF1330 family)